MKTTQNPRSRGVFFDIIKKTVLLFVATLLTISCSEADQIGLDMIESPAQMFSTDTISLQAHTLRDDSVATSLSRLNVLGYVEDPVFGKTRSTIYTETRLLRNEISLGENPQLDSIYLILTYEGSYYGGLGTELTLQVYELSENFPEQDTLFSNFTIPHIPEPLTKDPNGFSFYPAPRDSILVDTVMRMPQIRVPLSDAFGQKFIDANGTETFVNVPQYLEKFKGLKIMIDDNLPDSPIEGDAFLGRGSMFQIDMLQFFTAVELYYHNDEDTLMTRFPINEFANNFTHIEHFGFEDAHESLRAQIIDEDLTQGDSLLFLQSLGQVRTDIFFPFIDDLLDEVWLINKAELVVPVEKEFINELFTVPPQLLLLRHLEDGELIPVTDYAMGPDYFGGQFDETNNRYVFNITQYFQELIDGKHPNLGLALTPFRAHERPGRAVFHGPGRMEEPMKLILYYSVFE